MKSFVLLAQIFFKLLGWIEKKFIQHEERQKQANKQKAVALQRLRTAIQAKRKAAAQFDQRWNDEAAADRKRSMRVRFDRYERKRSSGK